MHSFTFPSANAIASQVKDSCTAAPPTLLTPAEGAVTNDLENPSYYWSPVSGINEYLFQIALDDSIFLSGRSRVRHNRMFPTATHPD